MRVLLMADIHGNLEALQACLTAAAQAGIDRIDVLGDIVGYGADPNPCVEWAKGYPCIKGNHDAAIDDDQQLARFNPLAKAAMAWTRRILTKENALFLMNLPQHRLYPGEGYSVAHGSLIEPYAYLELPHQFRENVKAMTTPLLFVAHTHSPALWEIAELSPKNGRRTWKLMGHELHFNTIVTLTRHMHIIDIGSVGQPRDDDPRGCCVIYDSDALTAQFVRFEYPIEKAAAKMKAAGLPEPLYKRLYLGQ